jgi:hypothetical protein
MVNLKPFLERLKEMARNKQLMKTGTGQRELIAVIK